MPTIKLLDTTDHFAAAERKAKKARALQVEANAPRVADSETFLNSLRADGWNLSGIDLRVMEGHIERISEAYKPMEVGSLQSSLINDAREAVKHERAMRKLARSRKVDEQRERIDSIRAAAHDLTRAHELMDKAECIEADPSLLPSAVPAAVTSESARAMNPKQLEAVIMRNSAEASRAESSALSVTREVESLEKFGGQQGKRVAKQLRAVAKDARDSAAAYRSNVSTARAELDRRAEAEAESAEASIAKTTADVKELLKRVAELEAQVSEK